MEYRNINPSDILVQSWSSKRKGSWSVTIDSGVKITHMPTGIHVTCDKDRSQHKNRHAALTELSKLIGKNKAP